MKKATLLLLLGLCWLPSCYKDADETQVETTIEDPRVEVNNLSLQVKNTDGAPIPSAKVWIDSSAYTTDEQGRLFLNKIKIMPEGAALRVEKPGYFNGVQRLLIDRPQTVVTMTTHQQAHTFQSTTGWSGEMPGEPIRLAVGPNAFQDSLGTPYDGAVQLYYRRLTKGAPAFEQVFDPVLAFSTAGDLSHQVAPFGVFLLEATTPEGRRLQLRPSQKVVLELLSPIVNLNWRPQSLLRLNSAHVWSPAGTVSTTANGQYQVDISTLFVPWTLLSVTNTNYLHIEIGSSAYVLFDSIVPLGGNNSIYVLAAANNSAIPNTLWFCSFTFPANYPTGTPYNINNLNFIWMEQSAGVPPLEIVCGSSNPGAICPVFLDLVFQPTTSPDQLQGIIEGALPDGRLIRGNFFYNKP